MRHFRAGIDGIGVHFVHERASSGRGIPLILTNGWPSCFAEFLPLVPLLTQTRPRTALTGPVLTWSCLRCLATGSLRDRPGRE